MPVIKLYQHGVTGGMSGTNKGKPGKRSIVQGWTSQSTRRNIQFLRSVTISELDGVGFAVTLTLKHCPPTHDDWKRLRENFFRRLRTAGIARAHWVTEWQRRGVPHLHGMLYFPDSDKVHTLQRSIPSVWCEVAKDYGPELWSQHVVMIDNTLGWIQYLAKHSSRGANHYQRSPENVPDGWRKTGRIWGKIGDWPLKDSVRVDPSKAQYHAFRRLVRSWRVGDARRSNDRRRLLLAKKMLKNHDPVLSEIRGISEWVPEATAMTLLHLAMLRPSDPG